MSEKARNWSTVIYPESLPENWEEIIIQSGLKSCLSPLHDKDLDKDGKLKKAHYHLIACWNSPTTLSNARSFCEKLGSSLCQRVLSVDGAIDYQTHANAPDKAQYNKEDIRYYNGFNPLDYKKTTRGEALEKKIAILNIIKTAYISEFNELVNFLIDNEMYEEIELVIANTYFYDKYICSRRHQKLSDIAKEENA